MRIAELYKLLEFGKCGAGGDGAVRQLGSSKEAVCDAGDDEGGGGVHDNDIAGRAGLALENSADQSGVFLRGAATESFEWSSFHAKIRRREGEISDRSAANFGDLRFAGEGDFVEPPSAVKDQGASDAKFSEGLGDQSEHVAGKHTQDLGFCARGICEGTEEIEHRAFTDVFSSGNRVARGGMSHRSEEEADADFADRAARLQQRKINANAEGFEHIGRAGKRANGTIAVLGDARACGGSHNRSGRRDIEGAA